MTTFNTDKQPFTPAISHSHTHTHTHTLRMRVSICRIGTRPRWIARPSDRADGVYGADGQCHRAQRAARTQREQIASR